MHIFKSSTPDKQELKRLKINKCSVMFINDEDIGRRRSVMHVGGVDVSTLQWDLNSEEKGLMWM